MIPRKTFISFLLDTPTGKAYYRSAGGNILTTVITAGLQDVSLKNAPGNWMNIELAFPRNSTYYGIYRSYATPHDFVLDAKAMIEELFLLGVGTEVPLTLAVFKYNSTPLTGEPNYKLYYKGNLDLPKIASTVLEDVNINLMEGGIGQLLKSYENTTLEIPCDGSLIENIKVNLDGLKVQDTFFYEFVFNNIIDEQTPSNYTYILSSVFINNEGDNFGVVKNDSPNYDWNGNYPGGSLIFLLSPNYVVYFSEPTFVRLKGNIVVTSSSIYDSSLFYFRVQSNKLAYTDSIIDITTNDTYVKNVATRFDFDVTFELQAFEKMFLSYELTPGGGGGPSATQIQILRGDYSIEFATKYKATRPWALTAYDLYKLMVKEICRIASTTNQTFSYTGESQLLQDYLNFVVLSGDALRASGDATYQRYFYLGENNTIQYGPVIKTTIKDFFQSLSVPLMAALSIGRNNNGEQLLMERLETVFDSSVETFSIGEIAGFKWRFSDKYAFTDVRIGYAPQTYDQKAGKYEYNTTLEMKAPVKFNEQKILDKVSKYRADSYGIERLRSNIGAATSTTRNDSDNSVFIIDTDRDNWIYDYFKASFLSLVDTPADPLNTNIHFVNDVHNQQIGTPIIDGEYFKSNTDNSIFVFSVFGYSATEACSLNISGVINSVNQPPGAAADTIIIKLWRNGVVLYSNTTTVSGVNTPISIAHTFSQAFAYGDCIYISMETSVTGEALINTADLVIGSGPYVQMSGINIPVLPGTSQKMLSFGSVTNSVFFATQYGYQYFVFNSITPNSNFDIDLGIRGYMLGAATSFKITVYINGVSQASDILIPGTVLLSSFVTTLSSVINRNFALNDIVFITATPIGALAVALQSVNLTITSTVIKAYNLYREQYDNLIGIPNIATDDNGVIRTDVAGAPYNLRLSPKTCYNRWKPFIKSAFLDQVTDDMNFQTLSKNKYLSRTIGGVTITENSNETILDGERLFYPIEIEGRFQCPLTFAEIMSSAVNAHVHATFMGNDIYFFVEEMKQKPALNETTVFKGLLSPRTALSTLVNLSSFKIPNMGPNSISCSMTSPVQFVPIVRNLPDKYHTASRNYYLFGEQVSKWFEKTGYACPVQIGDPIVLPFITRDLDPISYTVYDCATDEIYAGPTNLNTVASPAITDPYVNWWKEIDTSSWPRGNYYIKISSTDNDLLISECLEVRPKEEMYDTVLIEATNSQNTQGLVFDGATPLTLRKRFYGGYDNKFKQKYLGKFYIDQPQDITILNAIPYEITTLYFGGRGGVPDYEARKILRMLLLDGCMLDGEGFSLNEGAELEEVFTKGAPKKIYKVEIRPTDNKFIIVANATGPDEDSSMIVSVSPGAFGPNVTNQSGTTDTDLIEITITD